MSKGILEKMTSLKTRLFFGDMLEIVNHQKKHKLFFDFTKICVFASCLVDASNL